MYCIYLRSKKKCPFLSKSLVKTYFNKKKIVSTYYTTNRSIHIHPHFFYLEFKVYNGRYFFPLKLTTEHIGHKLGEFFKTRKKCVFRSSKKKKYASRFKKK